MFCVVVWGQLSIIADINIIPINQTQSKSSQKSSKHSHKNEENCKHKHMPTVAVVDLAASQQLVAKSRPRAVTAEKAAPHYSGEEESRRWDARGERERRGATPW
jgi:hypothetical protein